MNEKKYREWIKPGIYNGLQRASIPVFGVLSTMLLAHKALSKSEMGVWALFLVVTSFIDLFRSGIVRTSLIKYINFSESDEHRSVLSAAFFLNAIVSIIVIIFLFFGSGLIADLLKAPALKSMLHIFMFTLFILIPFSHFEWLMYGKSLFKGLFFTYILRQGSTLLSMLLVFLHYGHISLDTLVILYSGGILIGTLMGFLVVKPLLSLTIKLTKHWVMQLWNFGRFVFGSNIGTLIFRNADQFMLSAITANTALVASQNIAIRIMNIADIPSQVIADILFPKSSDPALLKNPSRIKYFYEKAVGASLSFILPFVCGILIFPKAILFVLAGDKYYDAIPYLQLIAVTGIFLSFLKQWGVIIDSTGRPHVNFMMLAFMAILEIGMCYYFISHFHLIGAAIALIITHLCGFIATQFLLNKYFKINFLNSFKYAFEFYKEIFGGMSKKMVSTVNRVNGK
ncbi:MAG: oligosaccharide flippase family protein [Ginsengibacter sp.]